MHDLFMVQIEDLWICPEDIVAIRPTQDGQASMIYCSDAHSFRVKATPEQILRKIDAEELIQPQPVAAKTPTQTQTTQYLQGLYNPGVSTTSYPPVQYPPQLGQTP